MALTIAVACVDVLPTDAPVVEQLRQRVQIDVPCTASLAARTVTCGSALSGEKAGVLIGKQNVEVKVASSNVSYNSSTGIFQFDVTVQNLMNEAIGTPGAGVADPEGIQIFFHSGPTVTSGTGNISVANADGVGTFTSGGQPYFAFPEILAKDQVSSPRTWQLSIDNTVSTFSFLLAIETDIEYRLVINEVFVNPAGTTIETSAEWFEVYNAGSRAVDMQNLVIADSAASGRRPYHLISSSLVVEPGGYVVLGQSTNTTVNGGVSPDYAYGSALALANSLDAVKISRVFGTDTITVDRTQYSNASVSAKDGISRELKNPDLDNSNMDGSNWGDASVTSVYGVGGRGTPKAQNSSFTPSAALLMDMNRQTRDLLRH
jgi:hypothetical protein